MKYGLPYKGSKNKLAERIVGILPQREHLYDLFCGGCAITHCAMLGRKFKDFHINDINWMCPTLFKDVLEGKYDNENRWISREDFHRLKDSDPYVAFVWSFGNNLRDYLYGTDIEPLKKAIHFAIFYADYSLGRELGHDFSFIDGIADLHDRYLAIKHYFKNGGGTTDAVIRECKPLTNDHTKCRTWKESAKCGGFQKKKRTAQWGVSEYGESLFRLIHQERHDRLPNGGGIIHTTHGDYQDVEILPNSVIYCDIPYRGTDDYESGKLNSFDYDRFYYWAERQTEPTFISEYWMPEDRFECIQEFAHRSILSASANNLVCEKLFVPKGQTTKGTIQLSLF